jgi:hypothetical protein
MIRIPLKHVVFCLKHKRIEVEDFYHTYYIVETIKKTYFEIIYLLLEAVLDPEDEDIIVLPPNLKRSVGQPINNKKIKNEKKYLVTSE